MTKPCEANSTHRPFWSNLIKWIRQMDLRIRIKKPVGNADFRAMIKDFDLVLWIQNQTLHKRVNVDVFNFKCWNLYNHLEHVYFIWPVPCISQDDDANVTQCPVDPTLTLSPPRLCRRRSLKLSGLRSNVGVSGPWAATARARVYHSRSRSQSRVCYGWLQQVTDGFIILFIEENIHISMKYFVCLW